jgi:hypothetical protein
MARCRDFRDYADADAFIGSRDSRKVGNNTYAERRAGEAIAIRLHATDVVTFHADGSRVLDTGGWTTVTTKDRINAYAFPFHVWSDRGTWKVSRRGEVVALYADGMRIGADGTLTYPDGADPGNAALTDQQTKKRIAKYLRGLTPEVWRDVLMGGAGGDCLYCQFVDSADGTPIGDKFADTSHLESHLDENYYQVSLSFNAVREAGYPNPGLILQIAPDIMKRALRKYFEARLLTGPTSGRRALTR